MYASYIICYDLTFTPQFRNKFLTVNNALLLTIRSYSSMKFKITILNKRIYIK